ncbi:MAG: class I SAM-dependent methyltransferase [Haloarculaceae archaeon]
MDPDTVRREWAGRTGTYSPEFYAHLGPNETSERLREVLVEHVGTGASVLELGCSSGRHLAHLHASGFSDLHGVEVNDDAFDVMAAEFPALHAEGQFYRDAIEATLPAFDDGAFDAVFSVETLQHLHPETEWVFDDVIRVTGDTLVTVENEDGAPGAEPDRGVPDGTDADADAVNFVDGEFPLYYRDWGAVFGDRGLVEILVERGDRDTTRVFRRPGAVQ